MSSLLLTSIHQSQCFDKNRKVDRRSGAPHRGRGGAAEPRTVGQATRWRGSSRRQQRTRTGRNRGAGPRRARHRRRRARQRIRRLHRGCSCQRCGGADSWPCSTPSISGTTSRRVSPSKEIVSSPIRIRCRLRPARRASRHGADRRGRAITWHVLPGGLTSGAYAVGTEAGAEDLDVSRAGPSSWRRPAIALHVLRGTPTQSAPFATNSGRRRESVDRDHGPLSIGSYRSLPCRRTQRS